MIGQTISHYEILEKLGEGGMGVVYKAQDTKLDRLVALKFLPQHLSASEQDKRRFIHEAKAASSLDHPNICTVYEIGETPDGQAFIAMACYEGETIQQKLHPIGAIQESPLRLDDVINFAIQIAEGLQAAHKKGIVHRDIKSSNIMVTPEGQVKIMDFGLAKTTGATMLTKSGATVGTVPYMSPEQARGEKVDHRTDIWSLGVVLYEMISGRLPFESPYSEAVVYSILNEEPKPFSLVRNDMPAELENVVKKCLQKNLANRYQHVNELLSDLRLATTEPTKGIQLKKVLKPTRSQWQTWYLIGGGALALSVLLVVLLPLFSNREEPIRSIAVLPLENLSRDPEQEYFADGMTEALITELAKLDSLRVISRTSVMRYKGTKKSIPEIGDELNVDAIVEGSVQRSGDRVRITAQLLHAPMEKHLWADSYERELRDIFFLQNEVVRSIVRHVKFNIASPEQGVVSDAHPIDPEVYDLYLRGKFHLEKTGRDNQKIALRYFESALAKDSMHTLSHIGVANVWLGLTAGSFAVSSIEGLSKAKLAIRKALATDPRSALAYHSLSIILQNEYDWSGALQAYERAKELDPNLPELCTTRLMVALFLGNSTPDSNEINQCLAIDPANPYRQFWIGRYFLTAGKIDVAISHFERLIQLDPGFLPTRSSLFLAYWMKGRYDDALDMVRVFYQLQRNEEMVLALDRGRRDGPVSALLAMVHVLERAKTKRSLSLAELYLLAGRKDRALDWLEKSFEERSPGILATVYSALWSELRDDPRFKALLRKMGLESFQIPTG